ncbi:MAG: radical SAM protein [Spirochaetales bacterium]|nr:radical SAM protein [Spirochaetales bacterium]
MNKIRIHGFIEESTVNGPGNRSVIWTQGCPHKCPNCFNRETWDINGGSLISVEDLLSKIPFSLIDGISISGGEPFLQFNELLPLTREVKKRGKDVLVYTGFYFNELQESLEYDYSDFLKTIDILIDGPYKEDVKQSHPWAGSGNQGILKLENGKKIGEIFSVDGPVPLNREIHILNDGSVLTTGFI